MSEQKYPNEQLMAGLLLSNLSKTHSKSLGKIVQSLRLAINHHKTAKMTDLNYR